MVRAFALAGIVAAVTSAPMQLRSPDFSAGGPLPRALMAGECGGENRSPALTWTNAPKGTKSFALVLHDADAPIPGGFYHWIVYNLPSGTQRLSANERPAPDQLGDTSLGKPGYYGPCPPPGPAHHYTLTLYALDVSRLSDRGGMTGAQIEGRIAGHMLARATLQGTASRP
jgi:Raf kinase inhibitor-like YbhB/YbcL family protein